MATFSHKTLFSLALSGLVATTAWSQEPQPAATNPAATAVAERPGVIHVSDCPPEDFGVFGADGAGESGMKCPEYVPPHSGWDPPGRRPVYRTWVPYHKFFPDSWTGTAAAGAQRRAPMVYMPTDTTQLGFYYQHAPTWHAYPGMLPPVPRPSDWHYMYREPVYSARPTVAPQPAAPTPPAEATPDIPEDATGLDRSAIRPDLSPVPQ